MTPERIDHKAQARSLVAVQYKESLRFLKTLDAIMGRVQELEDLLIKMPEVMDIDLATGVNLDILGDIVGVSRYIPEGLLIPYLGFDDTPGGMVFGEEGIPGVGARFYDEGEPITASTVMSDPEFRLMVKAKIVKNHSIGTCEDILRGLQFLFSGSQSVVEDRGGMKVDLGIGRRITFIERVMVRNLDLLPRPNGVKIGIVVSFESNNFFGFGDQIGAVGFGEGGSEGGIFAEELVE